MIKSGPITLGLGAFVLFAVLAGLALLMGANHAAPGCTGPAVERCDYIETAKVAVAKSEFRSFDQKRGFEIYQQDGMVRVQQPSPPGWRSEGPSVLIDKKSCRACAVEYHLPANADPRDRKPGRLIQRVPAGG